MNAQMKEQLRKGLVLLVSILLLAYVVYQVYSATHEPVRTEVIREASVDDTVDAETFVVRNESYLETTEDGTLIPLTESGSRVAAGEGVVAIFPTESEAADYAEMVQVQDTLQRYSRLAKQKSGSAVNLGNMSSNISNSVIDLAAMVDSGNLTGVGTQVSDIRDMILAKQIATGEEKSLESTVTELESRYAVLTKKTAGYDTLVSEVSGYYIDSADGYENTVAYDGVTKLKPSEIKKLMKADPDEVSDNVIGKVASDFDWYMVFALDSDKAKTLKKDNTVTVNLPYSAVNSVKATVYSKSKENSDGEVAVVLKCNRMDSYIASLRKESAEIVIHSYTGLKVPTEAIHTNEDGEKGVYVLEGNVAKFKKLRTVYSEDDFVISSETAKDGETGNYVKRYDSVIMSGKDLTDGKIFN